MSSIKNLTTLIGQAGRYNVSRDMYIDVIVDDVRITYGQVQVMITPVAGKGYTWVKRENVRFDGRL